MKSLSRKRAKAAPVKGRPPKPPAERRDVMLRVMVTAIEKEILHDASLRDGLDLSTWIRNVVLARAREGTA